MAEIRAVLGSPQAPGSSETFVSVAAIPLNHGEVSRSLAAEAGFNPRWDLAGTVEKAADDGTGPSEGARMVGLMTASVRLVVRLVRGFTGEAVLHVED